MRLEAHQLQDMTMRTMEKEDDPRTERNKCNDKTHEVKMNDDN